MDNIRFDINATDKSKPAFDSVRASADRTSASVKQFDRNVGELTGRILQSAPAFAIATAAIAGVYEAARLVTAELKAGFNAVEDYRNSVLQMAAVMTTFSQKAKEGDLAGGWKDSHAYAEQLISDLEIIDAKSAASGANIRDMVLSLTNHRVMVNTNLKEEQEAVIALANTIKALTGTQQNANMQYTQEINALMTGVSRPGDRLVQNLEAAGLNTKKFAQDLKQGKATIADIIPYLSGFKAASAEIAGSWDAVWSTIKTVNNRILRGGFEPIVDDIKNLGKEIIGIYTDQNGQLNEQAKTLQQDIRGGWQDIKDFTKDYGPQLLTILEYLAAWKVSQLAINVLVGKNPYVMVAAGVAVLNESLHKYNLGLQDTTQSAAELATNIKNIYEVIKGERDANTGFSANDLFGPKDWTGKKAQPPVLAAPPLSDDDKKAIDDAAKALQKTREEWEKTVASLSKQVTLGGLTGLAKELKQLEIEHTETVAKFKGFDTSGIDRFYEELAGQARVDAIEKIDTDLKSFFEDIEEFGRYAGVDNALTDFFTEMDASSYWIGEAAKQTAENSKNALQQVQTVSETVAGRLEDGFVSAFENISTGAKDMGDIVNDIFRDLANEAFRAFAVQPLLASAGSSLFGINGAFSSFTGNYGPVQTMHSGGVVGSPGFGNGSKVVPYSIFSNAGRYHSGLASDEFPAILQKGETVIPAGGSAAGSGAQNYYITIVAADSQSFTDMVKRNPQAVIAPFREALQKGDKGLRADIQRVSQ